MKTIISNKKNKTDVSTVASERIGKLPPYLFAEIDRLKRELLKKGKDIIDLGVGDPDLPTPKFIIEALREAAGDPKNHRYALDQGLPEFRNTIAEWFQNRYGIKLDPNREVLPLIGSKEGIGHLPLAIVNPRDVVLVPNPGYPVYQSATWFAGGTPVSMPLLPENQFLPDLGSIKESALKRAKLMYLNYPNNPTGACATKQFFKEVLRVSKQYGFVVCHDAAYNEMTYEGYRAPSIFEVSGTKERVVEFHSLSKTFNMTGWRVGFAVGNEHILRCLAKVKSNLDSGIFQAIQWSAITALRDGGDWVKKNCAIYERRRDILISGLNEIGWKVEKPKATFYVWIPVPAGYTSSRLTAKLLEEANLVVTPGNGFGTYGEGYIRMSLTIHESRLSEAIQRIKNLR